MSDNLKAGIEDLSGFAMDDVRVLTTLRNRLRYRLPTHKERIFMSLPDRNMHLPHEAWHVAQQMAGRVEPTTEVSGLPVNDCIELEHEADVMGARANNY